MVANLNCQLDRIWEMGDELLGMPVGIIFLL